MTFQVFSHHKCATIFLSRLLEGVAAHNGLKYAMTHRGDLAVPVICARGDIVQFSNAHGRLQASPAAQGLHIVRNPFSIVVSAYFSHLKTHPTASWPALERQRLQLQQLPKSEGLWATIAFLSLPDFYPATPGPLAGLRSWSLVDDRFTTLRMEDLVANPESVIGPYLIAAGLNLPDMSRYRFEQFSGGRSVGKIDAGHHFRSGDPDDYKQHLSDAQQSYIKSLLPELFERYYPNA